MFYLDIDGRISFGRSSSSVSFSRQSGNDMPGTPIASTLPPSSWHHLFQPGSWEYNVARLLQRVQETRCLLHEDLQEVIEPLRTLAGNKGTQLSLEQQAQQRAAEEDYQQAILVIDQALARMLRHFPTEVAILQQSEVEGIVVAYPFSWISFASTQKERQAEVVEL